MEEEQEGEQGEPGGSCMRNSGEVCRSQARELLGGKAGAALAAPPASSAGAAAAAAAAASLGGRTRWKSSGVAVWSAAAAADWNSAGGREETGEVRRRGVGVSGVQPGRGLLVAVSTWWCGRCICGHLQQLGALTS